jgi:hypothetical protein
MKKLFLIGLLAVSFNVQAATAMWTGQMIMAQSVTYQTVWNCQYQYAGNYFWRAFRGTCPSSIEVY